MSFNIANPIFFQYFFQVSMWLYPSALNYLSLWHLLLNSFDKPWLKLKQWGKMIKQTDKQNLAFAPLVFSSPVLLNSLQFCAPITNTGRSVLHMFWGGRLLTLARSGFLPPPQRTGRRTWASPPQAPHCPPPHPLLGSSCLILPSFQKPKVPSTGLPTPPNPPFVPTFFPCYWPLPKPWKTGKADGIQPPPASPTSPSNGQGVWPPTPTTSTSLTPSAVCSPVPHSTSCPVQL